MLVLARQEGDGITFPDLNLEVEVLRIQGRRVQLGIHASRELKVMRSELLPENSGQPDTSSQQRGLIHQQRGSCADPEREMAIQTRLRELSTQLAMAKAHWERGDLEGVERTLRSMAARSVTPEISVASDSAPSHVSEPAASYDCRSACQHLHMIHPNCPLKDTVRGVEGLAC